MNWKPCGSKGFQPNLRYFIGIFSAVTEEIRENSQKNCWYAAEIRTEHLLNASLERYRVSQLAGCAAAAPDVDDYQKWSRNN
jgi:hypothetical protein